MVEGQEEKSRVSKALAALKVKLGCFSIKVPTPGAQTQRRGIAIAMFGVLILAGWWLIETLIEAAKGISADNDAYAKGVVLTALSGALGSILTLVGLIVKGLVDNLTEGRDSQNPKRNQQPRRQADDDQQRQESD